MASTRLPSDWCFLGSHFNKDAATNRIRIVADYYSCTNCYGTRVQSRCKFLDGEDPRKLDSQPVLNPELAEFRRRLSAAEARFSVLEESVAAAERVIKDARRRLDDHRM